MGYDGPTTPKGQLMRNVYRGLAGFCSVDARAMAKSAMPDLEIVRHVRLSCPKPEALEANFTGHAEDVPRQWHRVATRTLESRANSGLASGLRLLKLAGGLL